MDKENGLFLVPDGFTPASASFSKLQRASTGFITILGFYMLLGMFFEALSPNFLF
jgi:hypothetical protein